MPTNQTNGVTASATRPRYRSQVQRCALFLAARLNSGSRSRLLSNQRKLPTRASRSSGCTMQPHDSSTMSSTPLAEVVNTGNPDANASPTTNARPSKLVGNTNTSASWYMLRNRWLDTGPVHRHPGGSSFFLASANRQGPTNCKRAHFRSAARHALVKAESLCGGSTARQIEM
jgi:hypothetical protein